MVASSIMPKIEKDMLEVAAHVAVELAGAKLLETMVSQKALFVDNDKGKTSLKANDMLTVAIANLFEATLPTLPVLMICCKKTRPADHVQRIGAEHHQDDMSHSLVEGGSNKRSTFDDAV